jgi:hypothetical protein
MIAQGAKLKSRYRLDRLLGRGGMAAVWLADDEVLDRPVAIKVLSDTIAADPQFQARFRREARVAAGLSHPNLIGVYDYADGDERPYLVMEYVAGETLAERVARKAAIDCERLARELLSALAHIHAAGIVHRDVKPQNVLIAPDGSAKLIDFGIALPRDATALTRTGHLLGTARYVAPEVMAGRAATERADLFSCGVVLSDCVGGGASGQLRALAARLSAEDAGVRPASAKQALLQIDRDRVAVPDQPTEPFTPTLSRPAVPAPGGSPTLRLEARRRRFPWGKASAAAVALAAVAVAVVALSGGGNGQAGKARRGNAGAETKAAASGAAKDRESAVATAPAPPPEAAAEPAAGDDPALGSSLNQQGFELIQAGSYDEAAAVLEEAVSAFPPGTEDLDYAYALFNLGNALRLSGRPDEAVPVLERRLEIPNQVEIVRRELAAAQREAAP